MTALFIALLAALRATIHSRLELTVEILAVVRNNAGRPRFPQIYRAAPRPPTWNSQGLSRTDSTADLFDPAEPDDEGH